MPLPPETLAKIRENIKEAETALKDMKVEIDRARIAGIDVTEMLKQYEDMQNKVRSLKAAYGGK